MGAVTNLITTLRKPRQIDAGKLQKDVERANKAEALLRDETLAEAFSHVESVYMDIWRMSGPLDIEVRERAHLAVLGLNDIRRQLLSYVQDGAVARDEIEKSLRR